MNKIRFAADPDTNYIFHILSVAKCGYDNGYGAKYRGLYALEDLEAIKEQEELLTVCGGQHCGRLYHLMVCRPAWGEVRAGDYFLDLPQRIRQADIRDIYAPYENVIVKLSAILAKYYGSYIRDIWPMEQARILAYIKKLEPAFEENAFTEQAEALVGCALSTDFFTASMVSSIAGGAEAIDISEDKDVFGIEHSVPDGVNLIAHEFIIYLLFGALVGEQGIRTVETWPILEGLGEFYLRKLRGPSHPFDALNPCVEFFNSCAPGLTAVQLYRLALEKGSGLCHTNES